VRNKRGNEETLEQADCVVLTTENHRDVLHKKQLITKTY